MLRLDWNILFNMINILILFLLMKRFLFKPVNEILEKRQAEADNKMAEARLAQETAQKKEKECEGALQEAEREGAVIISKAKETANAEYARILEEANQKAQGMVNAAAKEAEMEKEKILQQAKTEVRDLVLEAVARVTEDKDSAENDSALLDAFLRQNKN